MGCACATFNAKLPQALKMERCIVPVVKTLKNHLKEDGVWQDASSVKVVNMTEALARVDPAAIVMSQYMDMTEDTDLLLDSRGNQAATMDDEVMSH
jgi:hypothetical protein